MLATTHDLLDLSKPSYRGTFATIENYCAQRGSSTLTHCIIAFRSVDDGKGKKSFSSTQLSGSNNAGISGFDNSGLIKFRVRKYYECWVIARYSPGSSTPSSLESLLNVRVKELEDFTSKQSDVNDSFSNELGEREGLNLTFFNHVFHDACESIQIEMDFPENSDE